MTNKKTIPEKIYLQIEPVGEIYEIDEESTWCEDRINASDIEYIRSDIIGKKSKNNTTKKVANNHPKHESIFNNYYCKNCSKSTCVDCIFSSHETPDHFVGVPKEK